MPATQKVKVYPDLTALTKEALELARASDAPAERAQRIRGEGREFESLREYRNGDDYRTIDWKASARRARTMVRVYQPERNQPVLLLLDCGRHMAGKVDGRRKLDHAVDAALRMAKVGLDAGDLVGVLAFASDVRTYLPPRKGREHLRLLTEALYRAEAALEESDYGRAYDFAFARSSRRSMVVLFTDLVDPDASGTLVARTLMLRPRHLPVVASLLDEDLQAAATGVPQHATGRLHTPGRRTPGGRVPPHGGDSAGLGCPGGARTGARIWRRGHQHVPARQVTRAALKCAPAPHWQDSIGSSASANGVRYLPAMPTHSGRHWLASWHLPASVLLLSVWALAGCATPSASGPSGRQFGLVTHSRPGANDVPSSILPPRRALDSDGMEHWERIETERLLQTLWAVAGATNALGAEWEFRFWSQDGALTLLSFHQTEEGEGAAVPISREAFLRRLSRELPTLVGSEPREVTLVLEREETRWSADLDRSSRDTPPAQARTLPSSRVGASQETYRQVLETARRLARLMTVPRGGSAQLEAEVSLDDYRLTGFEPGALESSGNGPALTAPEEAVAALVAALLPFTHGLGERTIRLTLMGVHRHGEARPRWYTLAARTLESLPLPPEVADIVQEYRLLHEFIIVEFQEQSREYAVMAAGFTLEQLAYSIVGGLLLKGATVLFSKVAPIITAMLTRGGRGAVSWFRTLLARTPQKERELLRQLWMKAETQGIQSLTEAEKQQFRALMGRLEKVLDMPLDDSSRRTLRTWSRADYFELYNPQLAKALSSQELRTYQVHHVCPLEYAHLFPRLDINAKTNLVGVHQAVHDGITAVWNSLSQVKARMRPDDVKRVMEIVNRHYGRWYHKVYEPKDAAALVNAKQAALSEVAQVKAFLSP